MLYGEEKRTRVEERRQNEVCAGKTHGVDGNISSAAATKRLNVPCDDGDGVEVRHVGRGGGDARGICRGLSRGECHKNEREDAVK